MNELEKTNLAAKLENQTDIRQDDRPGTKGRSRRRFWGVGSASLATAALASLAVNAQEPANIAKGEEDHSASNPGPGKHAASE